MGTMNMTFERGKKTHCGLILNMLSTIIFTFLEASMKLYTCKPKINSLHGYIAVHCHCHEI